MSSPRPKRPSDRSFAKLTQASVTEMDRLSSRLASGKITVDEWADGFHDILVRAHTSARVLGRQRAGDLTAETEDDRRAGLEAADLQGEFLGRFADQLRAGAYRDEDGNLQEGGFMVRCRMYASRLRGTANQAFVDAGEEDEVYDWELGDAEHCADCIQLHSLNPYTADTIISHPGDGQTECKVNCHCRWVRRSDKVAGFSRVDVYSGPTELQDPGGEPSGDLPKPSGEDEHLDVPADTGLHELEDFIRDRTDEVVGAFKRGKLQFAPKVGEVNQVTLSDAEAALARGSDLTHNHPSGYPFSVEDLVGARKLRLASIRATTPQGRTFVAVAPGPKGWPSEKEIRAAHDRAETQFYQELADPKRKPKDRPLRFFQILQELFEKIGVRIGVEVRN